MISFEFHFEKWHEKTQKPLWLLGFPNRYLFRFAMLVAETGPDSPPSTSSVASLRACALLTPSGFVSPVRSALGSNCVGKKEDFIARPSGVLCPGCQFTTNPFDSSTYKSQKKRARFAYPFLLERVTGIEPARPAWKAGILPLNYTRVFFSLIMIPHSF